jgi:sec-independent protein translocase protein TatC
VAIPLLISSIVLFYLGMLFAYYVVFPLVFAFLTGTAPEGVAVMTDISHYLDFVLTLFFAFGIAFEIPIATILLVAAGITTPENLGRKRPYVIVGVFVAGMLLTPPDVISQTLLALPMWILFELGIIFSRFFQRRRLVAQQSREAMDESAGPSPAPAAARAYDAGSPPGEGLSGNSGAGRGASPAGRGPKCGGEEMVGKEVAGGDPFDPERFAPMTEDEMEAEMDAIEAEEEGSSEEIDSEAIDSEEAETPDPVELKLERIRELRDLEDLHGARRLLYEVLEEGDEEQRGVAKSILEQLDTA